MDPVDILAPIGPDLDLKLAIAGFAIPLELGDCLGPRLLRHHPIHRRAIGQLAAPEPPERHIQRLPQDISQQAASTGALA